MSQVSLVGSPYWVDYLASRGIGSLAIARFPSFRSALAAPWRLFTSRNVLVLGHGVPNSSPLSIWFCLFVLIWALGPHRPHIFMYWIGSEVPRPASRWPEAIYRWFSLRRRVHLICGAPWFVDALAERGLSAHPVLFPYDISKARAHAEIWPDPTGMIASTYLTGSHWENSNGDWIVALCRAWPQIRWRIIGMARDDAMNGLDRLDNVELCGWAPEPQRVMSHCHVFLRLTRTDAYAGTVRDAQAMRRIVFFTKPVPDCVNVSATDFEAFAGQFQEVVDAFAEGDTDRIAAMRSHGSALPDFVDSAEMLAGYIRDRNA